MSRFKKQTFRHSIQGWAISDWRTDNTSGWVDEHHCSKNQKQFTDIFWWRLEGEIKNLVVLNI
ncbi:hypothetical protein [Ureaplasma zalophigenitalium]|uniref:Uncharacterized protein n=1 Tax=Ureaplasma zalophigenitalium TaxID=907723 RepID=A0ABT3BNZ5_9BACT|nr:hypothetical protein [Ureaplasma zalophigenitalium]MCV3753959.1 hypothetical protein [Ureaplasma zalophigenitalium]